MHKKGTANEKDPITKPIMDDLKRKPEEPRNAPRFQEDPLPAELDQDSGGGYNPDGTIPQP